MQRYKCRLFPRLRDVVFTKFTSHRTMLLNCLFGDRSAGTVTSALQSHSSLLTTVVDDTVRLCNSTGFKPCAQRSEQ